MIKEIIFENVIKAVKEAAKTGQLGELKQAENLVIEKPKNPEFGDYAVNVSPLSRFAKMPPPKIAETILPYLKFDDVEITVVGGFINFKAGKSWLNKTVENIIKQGHNFGSNNFGNSEKVLLEYVSANPTGPLHIGHGRWAAVGSSLTNLMKFSGYAVDQEFYINDCGNQIYNLTQSLIIRILQQKGSNIQIPTDEIGAKNHYPGEYLIDIADKFIKSKPQVADEIFSNFANAQYDKITGRYIFVHSGKMFNNVVDLYEEVENFAKTAILDEQKELLAKFRVDFDTWYPESRLHKEGKVEAAIEKLKSQGEIYENEGAEWFRSSKYGDDQDRVIIKSDGKYTYLTADIAYHYDKLKRGYQKLINIWGADHHGYVARMKAAIEALGYDPNSLEVLLGQLVNLIIGGEQVRMGKRRKMLTLGELIDEVGVDATRFWMVMRSIDTTLDFDVDLAKSCSDENPVYYVQYAHARACSILRTATAERLDQDTRSTLPPFINKDELDNLVNSRTFDITTLAGLWQDKDEKALESTRSLIMKLEAFADLILTAVKARAPYMIARYVQELAGDFHHFYTFSRVLNVEEPVMKARLCLVIATKQVLYSGLNLLGVTAPESM